MEGANVLYLVIGGLLAIGGHLIIERIKKRGQKEEFRKGLLAELEEVRYRSAGSVYQLTRRYGTYNRDFLNWMHNIYTQYDDSRMLRAIENVLKLSDEQIKVFGEKAASEKSLVGLELKKYSLTFLDSNIGSLSLLDTRFQRLIIRMRVQFNLLNQEIDSNRFYFEKMFDSTLSNENYATIKQNLNRTYQTISDLSRDAVDQITYLIKELDVAKRYGGMTEEAIIYGIVKCIAQLKEDLLRKKKAR